MTDLTIELPGRPPIHTSTEALARAADTIGAREVADAARAHGASQFAKDQLKSIIERVERMEEEKKTIADDIREIYSEAKGNGFDVKALRTIVRMRKQDPNDRQEAETILETYMQALGMI